MSKSTKAEGTPADAVPAPPAPAQEEEREVVAESRARRKSRMKDPLEGMATFDRDQYNPDGSLRTCHQMPKFEDRYAQAEKATYIRCPELRENEKQLSINQIFDKS